MKKNIELEFRAEVLKNDFNNVLNILKKQGNLISKTKRLSVMFFGKFNNDCFDIRIRITNNESEIVIKKGELHSKDRSEYSQKINNDQFVGMVKLISKFGFRSKVGERETFNFQFPNQIIVSLVRAGDLSYLEIEKMTNENNIRKDKEILYNLAKDLKVDVIEDKNKFDDFCKRLDNIVDWEFRDDYKCYRKLEKLLFSKF
ncbi:MAG: hypothetical protein ABIA02_03930 [Candidatus Falkowbacteria bacterium]